MYAQEGAEWVDATVLTLGSRIVGKFLFVCEYFLPFLHRIYSFCNEKKCKCRRETCPVRGAFLHAPSPPFPPGFGTMLSSVALLSILVFVPSAVVAVLLLVRMGRKSAGLKRRSKSGYKKSSIEVSDE